MRKLTQNDLAKVDGLMKEINLLKGLIATEQDKEVREELKEERLLLVCQVNQVYGTDHIVEGSRITVMNNDFNNDLNRL